MGRLGTTDYFITGFLHFFSILHCPLGLGEFQACPFPDVSLPISSSLYLVIFPLFTVPCKMVLAGPNERGDMSLPLQFASLYDGQEVFVWSDCLQRVINLT